MTNKDQFLLFDALLSMTVWQRTLPGLERGLVDLFARGRPPQKKDTTIALLFRPTEGHMQGAGEF